MSQTHLVLDFPIEAPADAKALAEEMPELMPDLAAVQDDLGTVHFSRFMLVGDQKLLFLSDIDGDGAEHIERLVERAGPVFDAILKHVDEPARHARGRQPGAGRQVAQSPCPRAYGHVLRVRGRDGSGRQGCSARRGLQRAKPRSIRC